MGKLKEAGTSVLMFGTFLLILAGMLFLAVIFMTGSVWIADAVLPWLTLAGWAVLAVNILVLLPLAAFGRTRRIAGTGILFSSYLYGAVLWLWSLLLTYILWGWFAVFIGLFFFGVGVVPIAILATLLNGMFGAVVQLIILVALTFGSRMLGFYLIEDVPSDAPALVDDTPG